MDVTGSELTSIMILCIFVCRLVLYNRPFFLQFTGGDFLAAREFAKKYGPPFAYCVGLGSLGNGYVFVGLHSALATLLVRDVEVFWKNTVLGYYCNMIVTAVLIAV